MSFFRNGGDIVIWSYQIAYRSLCILSKDAISTFIDNELFNHLSTGLLIFMHKFN